MTCCFIYSRNGIRTHLGEAEQNCCRRQSVATVVKSRHSAPNKRDPSPHLIGERLALFMSNIRTGFMNRLFIQKNHQQQMKLLMVFDFKTLCPRIFTFRFSDICKKKLFPQVPFAVFCLSQLHASGAVRTA